MNLLYTYLLIINAVGFLFMMADKRKAIKNQWRIPERVIILTAAIGGSIGTILGMYAFRHKTKNLNFTLGLPVVAILQIAIVLVLYWIKK